jgi:succinyl-CoA synthetase beta subunit
MISSFSKILIKSRQPVTSSFKSSGSLLSYQRRFFDLHEYQSKYIMAKHGINVQKGDLASTPEQAAKIASTLSNKGGLILKA